MTTQLISSISVEGLVAERNRIITGYNDLVASAKFVRGVVEEANHRFPIACAEGSPQNRRSFFGMPAILVAPHRYDRHSAAEIVDDEKNARDSFVSMIDAGAWAALIDSSGIRSFMSAAKRADWDRAIHERRTAPFTQDYIESTINDLMGNRVAMMEEGVLEVFRRLSTGFKTNQPQMFGKKIIVDYLWSSFGAGNRWQTLCGSCTDSLDDLMRVMSIMDGKPEPDHRHGLHAEIRDADGERKTVFENEYFSLKWFKKAGTGHLTFKRLDLVEKLNKILAKHFPNAIASDLREKKTTKPTFSVKTAISPRAIGAVALRALQKAEIRSVDGSWLVKMGMMDRPDYLEANTVLETLGGKWQRGPNAHVFANDPSGALSMVVERGAYLDPKDLGFFPTPDDLVQSMIQVAGLKPGMLVLEPSAGNGSIAKAAVAVVGQESVTCIEYYSPHIPTLKAIVGDSNVTEKDFLETKPVVLYDVVLMNPPFSRNQDIMHVQHAWKFVKPGGRLVAIMATGWMNNQNATAADFRKFAESISDRVVTPLGHDLFEDTNVATVMLVLEKPAVLAMAA